MHAVERGSQLVCLVLLRAHMRHVTIVALSLFSVCVCVCERERERERERDVMRGEAGRELAKGWG